MNRLSRVVSDFIYELLSYFTHRFISLAPTLDLISFFLALGFFLFYSRVEPFPHSSHRLVITRIVLVDQHPTCFTQPKIPLLHEIVLCSIGGRGLKQFFWVLPSGWSNHLFKDSQLYVLLMPLC